MNAPNLAAMWHSSPIASRILARLEARDVKVRRLSGIPNDFDHHFPLTDNGERLLAALEEVRRSMVELAFGATFEQAQERDQADEYLLIDEAASSVDSVVAEALANREPQSRAAETHTLGAAA